MKVEATQLDEVIAVGYGVQKKSDVTGALVSVSSEEIASRPVNNPEFDSWFFQRPDNHRHDQPTISLCHYIFLF